MKINTKIWPTSFLQKIKTYRRKLYVHTLCMVGNIKLKLCRHQQYRLVWTPRERTTLKHNVYQKLNLSNSYFQDIFWIQWTDYRDNELNSCSCKKAGTYYYKVLCCISKWNGVSEALGLRFWKELFKFRRTSLIYNELSVILDLDE